MIIVLEAETAGTQLSEFRCVPHRTLYPAKPSQKKPISMVSRNENGVVPERGTGVRRAPRIPSLLSIHAHTQLRLASPARSHARTKRNDFPVELPPTSDILYITYYIVYSI